MTTDMHDGEDCPILWEGCAPTWPPLPSPVPDATPYSEELLRQIRWCETEALRCSIFADRQRSRAKRERMEAEGVAYKRCAMMLRGEA
jgi:hypothetical protein